MQTFCDIFYLDILILSNDFVQMVKSSIRTTLNWLVDENITDQHICYKCLKYETHTFSVKYFNPFSPDEGTEIEEI